MSKQEKKIMAAALERIQKEFPQFPFLPNNQVGYETAFLIMQVLAALPDNIRNFVVEEVAFIESENYKDQKKIW